jgi:hypothetical protein
MAFTKPCRVRLPMGLLTEPLPSFAPGEINISRKLSFIDRRAPIELLYQMLTRLGCTVADYAPGECDRFVSWSAKHVSDDAWDKAIVLEMGWIPRWTYQASPTGSNAQGHYARGYHYSPLTPGEESLTRDYLARLRRVYAQAVNPVTVNRLRQRLGGPFFLFAFQLANDHNLRFSRTAFSTYYAPDPSRNSELAQACIDAIEAVRSPFPVVFKQHPFDPTTGFRGAMKCRGIVLDNEDDVSTHELYATGLCQGAISINSNSLHDAAVWDVPALCLGSLIWHEQTEQPPFPRSFDDLDDLPGRKPSVTPEALAYLFHLLKNQWTLTDFQNGLMVEALLESRGLCEPYALRGALGIGL